MRYAIRLHFPTSNNAAEYKALVNGPHIAIKLRIKRLDVRGDSRLIIDQVMKESSCHDLKMDAYCKAVRCLEEKFDGLELNHVLRKYNEAADALTKMVSERAMIPSDVFVSDLYKPSIDYKDDGGSDHTPRSPRLRSRRPWTSSLNPLHQMTRQTGATPCCNASSTALCPQTRLRHDMWLVVPRLSSFSMERCTSAAPRAFSCAASHIRRESSSWRIYTRGLVATTPRLGR